MVDYYVWSGSAQDDSDATWNSATLAYLDLVTCLAAVAAGSNVVVADDHSKAYSGDTTYTNNGTLESPIIITCVNRTTGAVTTGALEQTTSSGDFLKWCTGFLIIDGVDLKSAELVQDSGNCALELNNSLIEFVIDSNSDDLQLIFDDADFKFRNIEFKALNAGCDIQVGGGTHFEWVGGGISATSTELIRLFQLNSSRGGTVKLVGLDLTNIGTSIFLLSTNIALGIYKVLMIGCKLPSGVPILASSTFSVPHEVIAHSCDTGGGYWYFEETYIEGQVVQATNCFLNATYDGTNGFSAKLTSNANALDQKRPLRFKLSEFYSTANPTLTVETITAGVTLQDDEFWLEIEYPNSTDEALRDIDDSSRQEVGWSGGSGPGTPSNLTTSTEGWTEDLASEVKQKVAVAISGGAAGIHTVWACLAKPSTTVYVDPKVVKS